MLSGDEVCFGMWTVTGSAFIGRSGRSELPVRCECGTTRTVVRRDLIGGRSTSCGCGRIDAMAQAVTKHGLSSSPEYRIWAAMIERCTNTRHKDFSRYGGRGITVCARWRQSFETFLADMGARPSPTHEIDRRDNDGIYEPDNCRWSTRTEQNRNSSHNRLLTFRGETLCVSAWAERMGISRHVVTMRLRRGWSAERALTVPPRGANMEHEREAAR